MSKLKISIFSALLVIISVLSAGVFYFSGVKLTEAATWNVAAGPDDVLRYAGGFFNNSTAFDFGGFALPTDYNHSAARFTNINIPQGSAIKTAYFTVVARANEAGNNVLLRVYAEAANTASQIASAADFDGRPLTAGTAWNITAPWTAGTAYNSPDISAEIQAVINRAGWVSGNAINIFVKDNGSADGQRRLGASFENNTYAEPSLTITWNSAPAISSATDSPDPVIVGSQTDFNVNWSDPDAGDLTRIHLCKTNAISGQSCTGGAWCETAGFSAVSPTSCSYTAQAGDMGVQNYFAFVCDDDNACSAGTAGAFTVEDIIIIASADSNVSGWAWSENAGWISFNSTDCDPNGDGNPGDGPAGCVEAGRNYALNPIPDYGVDIDPSTGDFSGYAWSENIGWISFNRTDTGNPPFAPYNGGSGPIANYSFASQRVRGWARALANGGGWDGWIKLGDDTGLWPTGGQQVSIPGSDEFTGWAWGSDVVGWVSFNRLNCDTDGDGFSNGVGGCPPAGASISNYKVVANLNSPPSAVNLSFLSGDYCAVSSPPVFLSWEFSDPDAGSFQSAYQVQIDNNSDFSSPEINSGKVASGSNTYAPINLSYNTTYFWRVIVWDDSDIPSLWSNGPSFATGSIYPSPNFTYAPSNPSVNETVQFTDSSAAFGGASLVSWSWTFQNGNPASSVLQNPTSQFTVSGSNAVTLRVTDSNGNSCQTSGAVVNTSFPLPEEWKEIRPF